MAELKLSVGAISQEPAARDQPVHEALSLLRLPTIGQQLHQPVGGTPDGRAASRLVALLLESPCQRSHRLPALFAVRRPPVSVGIDRTFLRLPLGQVGQQVVDAGVVEQMPLVREPLAPRQEQHHGQEQRRPAEVPRLAGALERQPKLGGLRGGGLHVIPVVAAEEAIGEVRHLQVGERLHVQLLEPLGVARLALSVGAAGDDDQ